MRRDRWRIILHPRMCSARKRKIEGLDQLEAHNELNSNGGELDTSVHWQPRIVSRIREAKSPRFKKRLIVPKQTEIVSAKGRRVKS